MAAAVRKDLPHFSLSRVTWRRGIQENEALEAGKFSLHRWIAGLLQSLLVFKAEQKALVLPYYCDNQNLDQVFAIYFSGPWSTLAKIDIFGNFLLPLHQTGNVTKCLERR